jgi:ketosteroid isomerase-like protein
MTTPNPVLEFTSKYKAAVYEKNAEIFASLYDKDVRVFDAWQVWSFDGIGAWKKMAADWFGSLGDERVVVEFEDVQSNVRQQLCTGSAFTTYTAVDAAGKSLRSLTNRHTWVLEHMDGQWKVIHEHSSAPADFQTMKVSLQR